MAEDPTTAPAADGAPAPHPTDNIPVDVVTATDASAKPAEGEGAPVSEPAAAPAAEGAEASKKPPKLPEWAEKKLAESSFEAREAKRRAKEAEDKLAALEAEKAAAAAAPATPNAADDAAARAAAPEGGYKSQAEFDAAVAAEATRREAQARERARMDAFNENSNKAFTKGTTDFGDGFKDAVSNLHQVGLLPYADQTGRVYNNEILEMVLATDDPAKVLYELGSDPDKAAAIVQMTPAARAVEIAKLSVIQPAKGKPTPLSNAPRPVPPVDGSARVSSEPSDDDDDETFFRKREAQLAARAGA